MRPVRGRGVDLVPTGQARRVDGLQGAGGPQEIHAVEPLVVQVEAVLAHHGLALGVEAVQHLEMDAYAQVLLRTLAQGFGQRHRGAEDTQFGIVLAHVAVLAVEVHAVWGEGLAGVWLPLSCEWRR